MNRTIGLISTNYSVPGFGSVTEVRPAASIPFGGRYRLLDFALSNMVNSRIQTVGLVTPYFYRSIMDHVGAGKPWDLSRKEGGLYILPGTVFGFHEENAVFSSAICCTTWNISVRATATISSSAPARSWRISTISR